MTNIILLFIIPAGELFFSNFPYFGLITQIGISYRAGVYMPEIEP